MPAKFGRCGGGIAYLKGSYACLGMRKFGFNPLPAGRKGQAVRGYNGRAIDKAIYKGKLKRVVIKIAGRAGQNKF